MNNSVYLDHAATGGVKPACVKAAVARALDYPGSPNRGAHAPALAAMKTTVECRERLAEYFDAPDPERIVFTKNATEALNLALVGSLQKGDHVISSCLEHNSVARPLHELRANRGIEFSLISPDQSGILRAESVLAAMRPNTRMIAVTACSNVTGGIADLAAIGRLCRETGKLFLADGAQAAGHQMLSMRKQNIDLLALPAHKGMLAPMGLGVLLMGERVLPKPLLSGGTGSDSELLTQPHTYPDGLEAGTLNLPAIAGLNAAVVFLQRNRVVLNEQLAALGDTLRRELLRIDELTLYAAPISQAVFSFRLKVESPQETADYLADEGIAVRAGLHCAPLAHRHLGTENGGLVRVGLSPFNTQSELRIFIDALKKRILDRKK